MIPLLQNFLYFLSIYLSLLFLSVFLLDIIWIKRAKFFLLDHQILSGYRGILRATKLAFSKELQ
jgi:hypothetical protein